MICTEAGEQRSRLQMAAALDSQTATEQHQAETAELRRQLGCVRDDVTLLQKQLADAGDHQAALVVELRRMAQQLNSGQMELEASRAIASAQRETILVREAEITRLEAHVGLIQRNLQHSTQPSRLHAEDGNTRPGSSALSLPNIDMTALSVSCPQPPTQTSSVGVEHCDAGSTAADVELPSGISHDDDSDRRVSDNPDSLLAMWHQLQVNDSSRHSAGDSTTSTRLTNLRSSTVNPPVTASTRLGSALEEKARVQNRIKALIGYREPAKKSSAATKPRMSVRPQPLNHSKSSIASTSTKQQRRVTASNSANTSQLSTAVSHYTASSVDHLTTS